MSLANLLEEKFSTDMLIKFARIRGIARYGFFQQLKNPAHTQYTYTPSTLHSVAAFPRPLNRKIALIAIFLADIKINLYLCRRKLE